MLLSSSGKSFCCFRLLFLIVALLAHAPGLVSAAAFAEERPETLIATALQAGPVNANPDGSFSVDLEIRLQNVGREALVEVTVFSDLAADLAPATVVGIDNLRASGALSLVSSSFNGGTDRFMLPGTERLESDDEAFVRYTLTFAANGNSGPFQVSAQGWAAGEFSRTDADDVSQDGVDPDPDTPGNAPIDNPDPHDDFEPTPLPPKSVGSRPAWLDYPGLCSRRDPGCRDHHRR